MTPEQQRALALARARARAAEAGQSAPAQTATANAAPEPPAASQAAGDSPTWMRLLGLGTQGFNEGLATAIGAPVSAVNNAPRLLNILPGEQGIGPISDEAVGGIESMRGLFESAGLTDNFEAENMVERAVERVGEEFGVSVLPYGGVAARGANLAARGVRPGQMGAFDRAFVAPFLTRPGATTAAETGSAVGAGAGAAYANETYGDDAVLAELLFATIGGAGVPLAGGAARNTAAGVGDLFGGDRIAQEAAGRILYGTAHNPDAMMPSVIRGAASDESPLGLQRTLAQTVDDAGIANLEYSRAGGGANSGQFSGRRQEQMGQIREALAAADPGGTPLWMQALNAALGEAQPSMARQEIGAQLRDQLTGARTAGRAEESAAWRAIDPEGRIGIDREATTGAIQRAAADIEAMGHDLPPQLQRLAGRIRPAEEDVPEAIQILRDTMGGEAPASSPMTFEEVNGMISELYDARATLASGVRDSKAVNAMDQLIDGLRGVQRQAVEEQAPDAAELWEAARGTSRQFNDDFTRGNMGAALGLQQNRGPAVENSDLGTRFLPTNTQRGGAETLDQFNRVATPEARTMVGEQARALGTGAFEQASNQAGPRTGGQALERWMAQRTQALARTPDAAARLQTLADVAAISADTAEDGVRSVLQRNDGGAVIERLAMRTDLNPQARENLKAGFARFMRNPSGRGNADDIPTMAQTRQFIDEYGPVMRSLYADEPETLANLEELPRALELLNRMAQVGRAAGTSGTAQSQAASRLEVGGVGVPQIASRIFAVRSGRTSWRYMTIDLLSQMVTRTRERTMGPRIAGELDSALMDPEYAANLVERYLASADDQASRELDALLLRQGARVGRQGLLANQNDEDTDQ